MDEQHCQVYQRSFGRSKIGFTMRDIRRCLKYFEESADLRPRQFFVESTYRSRQMDLLEG